MPRWTRCLLIGAAAVLVPALAGCEAGLDAPTQEFHPAAFGASTLAGGLSVDDAFVLGPGLDGTLSPGGQAGVFLALDSNTANGDKLLSVAAPGTANSVRLVGGPVTLAPGNLVTLTGPAPKIVLEDLTTSLSGGDTVTLQLTFANAGVITLEVPVEPDAYDYSSYSPPPPSPTPAVKHHVKPTPGASASASSTATTSPSPTP